MDLLVEQLIDLCVQAQVLEEPVDHHADPGGKDSGQFRSLFLSSTPTGATFGKTQKVSVLDFCVEVKDPDIEGYTYL